jgi:hypothetical protein
MFHHVLLSHRQRNEFIDHGLNLPVIISDLHMARDLEYENPVAGFLPRTLEPVDLGDNVSGERAGLSVQPGLRFCD